MKKWWSPVLALVALLLQLLFYRLLRNYPQFVESYYSMGIYPYIARAMRMGLGWVPFSFGDVVYALLIFSLLRWLFVYRLEVFTLSRKRILQLLLASNILLLFFHFSWGFNYYREPLHRLLKLEETYSNKELSQVTHQLILTANKLHGELQPNDSLAVYFKRSQNDLFKMAPTTWEKNSVLGPIVSYRPNSIKKSLLSLPLTYMGYSGYLNPITGEAQTNAYINNYKTPVLILHEMSHQLGFAKENEANFIAVVSGLTHPDPYFQYSACIFALRYCLNDLYRKDQLEAEMLRSKMKLGIFKNYQELTDFWAPYDDNVIEKVSQASYNKYLEANNQPDGMRTYSYVVALLVNYYK